MGIIISLIAIFIFPIYLYRLSKKKEQEEKERRIEQKRLYEEQMRRIRETEEARLEKLRKEKEETDKILEEKRLAYNKMLEEIQQYPIECSGEKSKKIAISFLRTLTYSTITIRTNIEKLGNFVVNISTGLKFRKRIAAISIISSLTTFNPVEIFTTLCAPSKPIPEKITELTNITEEMVSGKPSFQQVSESLVAFIGEDNLVGHNLPFDLKFIVHYGANVTEKKRKYFDTLDLARKTIRGEPSYKLKTLCFSLGIIFQDAHRAKNDALATGLVFQKLAELRTKKT